MRAGPIVEILYVGRRLVASGALVLLLVAAGAVALRASRAGAAVLVIDRGGTYSGTWESDDPDVTCVRVATAEPVIIENSTVRGRGDLIVSREHQAKITIRNTRGFGLNPNVVGRCAGRFVDIERFANVTIQNCSLESTAGIYLLDYEGDRTDKQTVRIIRNTARNIDGRHSDGKGGYTDGVSLVQFAQLDKVRHLAGGEIAWNQVINEPDKSRVEDNISVYMSSGTAKSPLRIHDNFIRGGYATHPHADGYSGGGIMLADGVSDDGPDGDSSFVVAERNHVLDTSNYGIAISAGHDCEMVANRIVSAGVLPDGRKIAAQNVGAYVWNSYKSTGRLFNNGGRDNLIGWMKTDGTRNDWWRPDAEFWDNNTPWQDPITAAVYEQEWKLWQEKCAAANMTVGPTTAPATSPAR
jgi:hypothetical protein